LPLIRRSRNRPVVICDWHNIESEVMNRYARWTQSWAQKLYALRTSHLIRKVESRLLRQCDAHIVVSQRDKSALQELVPKARVHVVENGVDTADLSAGEQTGSPLSRTDIIFVGSMDYHANVDGAIYFSTEVWPTIRSVAPQLHLRIVGSNPTREVRDLAQLPGISVTGAVDDVRPYYRRAFAAVVPLRIAGGTRLKVLEAMATGTPVVSTSIGAEGLEVKPGVHILLADEPEALARSVLELSDSNDLWQRLSQQGRELAHSRYDWQTLGSSLCRIHHAVLEHRLHG
jgi:polysaccharide biosynthesis protein PslH